MPSAVQNVVNYLVCAIKEVSPNIKESPNAYNFENNTTIDKFVFGVRPLNGNSIAGTPKASTINQPFEIELQKEFVNTDNSDKKLREAVYQIHEEFEKIYSRISLRNANDVRIMLIGDFSFSSPNINYNKKTVSVIFTHSIQYRNHIKEGV